MTVAEQFGANLAYCRRKAGLSQEDLAVLASLHRTAVGQLERAERCPRLDTFIKLAGSLGIDPSELLEGSVGLRARPCMAASRYPSWTLASS